MRKFLSLLLTMAMVLSLAVTVNAAAPKEDITILHTNDVHCDYEKYAKVATLHKSADLLVDAGDHVQGGVIGTLSKGEYIVDIMNYLKYDAAVPGNHEFDYGMDQFLHIAKDLAKYPYISANFTGKDGKTYLAHTLNNTCVAPPRMLIAFLENHLQADGTVTIPEVLQPYMGGLKVMVPTNKKA